MKTMRILTNSYNEPQQQSYEHITSPIVSDIKKPATVNNSKKKRGSVSSVKKSSPLVKQDLCTLESEDEDEDHSQEYDPTRRPSAQQPPLSKEDKRRRNTAASARFRVKKKLREQALQQTANEMTEKAKAFENRVHELEREVKWLKALIVEKKDGQLEQMLMQRFEPPRPPPGYASANHPLSLDTHHHHPHHGYLGNDISQQHHQQQ
jgi:GTPase Era involved in 16S rRNA processing